MATFVLPDICPTRQLSYTTFVLHILVITQALVFPELFTSLIHTKREPKPQPDPKHKPKPRAKDLLVSIADYPCITVIKHRTFDWKQKSGILKKHLAAFGCIICQLNLNSFRPLVPEI